MPSTPMPVPLSQRQQPASAPKPTAGPFRVSDLPGRPMTRTELARNYQRVFHGVYVRRGTTVTQQVRLQAAMLRAPDGSFVSHQSAGRWWGGIVPDDTGDVHISSPGTWRSKTTGIAGHRGRPGQATTTHRGIHVTTPVQTFVDLAPPLPLVDLVVLGDSLVKVNRATPELIVGAAAEATGAGAALARQAASYVRRGVDSPMETRLRMLMVLGGLPEPEINHVLRDKHGGLLYRFDLAYWDKGLVIEYDGRQHADSSKQWQHDVMRDEDLDDLKIRRLVVLSHHIYRTPGATLARILKAMRSVGMPLPDLSDEWRRHFPSCPEDVTRLV